MFLLNLLAKLWISFTGFIFELINHFQLKIIASPISEDGLLALTAIQLAEGIRQRKFTSRSVIEAYIQRIVSFNKDLNLMVQDRFAAALVEADLVDAHVRDGTAPDREIMPFYGVPFTLKDCIFVEAMKCTAGIVRRSHLRMPRDAEVVTNMKQAGAICLCITNVSEVCMWWEANNHIYGRSRNPYDSRRITGGSSGGEAGLIAAAGSVWGIGSDIGGSIRMPAYFNGIFGHKPTKFTVSEEGTHPACYGYQHAMHSAGPMCRYATDLKPMLEVLAGPDSASLMMLNKPVDLSQVKFYYMEGINFPAVPELDSELKGAMDKVVNHFQSKYGIKCQKVHFPSVDNAMDLWTNDMKDVACPKFSQQMVDSEGDTNPAWEIVKCALGCSDHTAAAIGLAVFENMERSMNPHGFGNAPASKLIAEREALEKDFASILEDGGVCFFPPHPTLTPYHNQPIVMPFNFIYTALFNSLTLPTTQVPLGLGTTGMPLGIQVVSSLHGDRYCLAVACELEKAFGGWVNPGQAL